MEQATGQEVIDNSTAGADSFNMKPRRRWLRGLLLTLGPLLFVTIGSYFYITGGRYIETDNAYVKADKVSLSAQVSGAITAVLVAENEHVLQGQELFRIDATPYQVALSRAQARLQGVRAFVEGLRAGYYQKQAELKPNKTPL